MNLRQQIAIQLTSISQTKRTLAAAEEALTLLLRSRVNCPHDFTRMPKEHTGKPLCFHCGLDEVGADVLSWKKRTGRYPFGRKE